MSPIEAHTYSMSFTAASVRPQLARIVAEIYIQTGNWDETKRRTLSDNLLQARSKATAIRFERELRNRLQMLSPSQINILAASSFDSCTAIAWLSVLKHSAFVFDFAADALRAKLEDGDPILRPSDYESFVAGQTSSHPELAQLSVSTSEKIRRVIKTMLREAGILHEEAKVPRLSRPVIPPDALAAILADDRKWLAGFMVPEAEIMKMWG